MVTAAWKMADQSVTVNISALSSALAAAIQQATAAGSSQPQPPASIPGSSRRQLHVPPPIPANTQGEGPQYV